MGVIDPLPGKSHTHKHLLKILGICRLAKAAQIDGSYAKSLAFVLAILDRCS